MTHPIVIVGAGPAGLMAAEAAVAASGAQQTVIIIDQMPSPARKFLMAGRGGLNLTHSEPLETFLARYPGAPHTVIEAIRAFTPGDLIAWAHDLGIETFTGSSGRVFPLSLKASPLLRAWLARLAASGVELHRRHRWTGFGPVGDADAPAGRDAGARPVTLEVETPSGTSLLTAASVVLAVGGGSWPRLGSDGAWRETLAAAGLETSPFAPSNAGVLIAWSDHMTRRFAGAPLKRIAVSICGQSARGDLVITRTGLEGGAVYALSPAVRNALEGGTEGHAATLLIDLRPDLDEEALARRLARPRNRQSLANHLRKAAGLSREAIALLRETTEASGLEDPASAAGRIKAVPLEIIGIAGLDRAISTVGGIPLQAIDASGMLRARPGVFAAGEMLDWDAPTGGYLLQACFATGRRAGVAAAGWAAAQAGPDKPTASGV